MTNKSFRLFRRETPFAGLKAKLLIMFAVSAAAIGAGCARGDSSAAVANLPETTPAQAWRGSWDTSRAGQRIKRNGLVLAKSIRFRAGPGNACLDETTGRPAIGRARAGAPGFDLYAENVAEPVTKVSGGVLFRDSTAEVVPYDCAGDALNIHLTKQRSQWQSATLYGVDATGRYGDSAPFGLFEQTIVLPAPTDKKAPWPAAWSVNHSVTKRDGSFTELDWMECGIWGGVLPGCYINLFNWPAPHPTGGQLKAERVFRMVPTINPFDGKAHTYSALVTPSKVVIYWDGVEMARYPVTAQDMTYEYYHAADLSMYYDPGENNKDYTAKWLSLSRWTCQPYPDCLDALNT